MAYNPKSLKDLKAASYNPREITDKELVGLETSIHKFGDLSGITFNAKTGLTITGHQRIRVSKGFKNRIVKKPYKDKHGTVAIGHVEITSPKGNVVTIPYREVDWDSSTEMAANVAANASGGKFEMVKLGKLMKELEKKKFPIEDIPLDSWTHKKALAVFGSAQKNKDKKTSKEKEAFDKVDPKAMKFQHQCPKCSYRW